MGNRRATLVHATWLKKMEPHKILGLHDDLLRPNGIIAVAKELEAQTALVKNMQAARIAALPQPQP